MNKFVFWGILVIVVGLVGFSIYNYESADPIVEPETKLVVQEPEIEVALEKPQYGFMFSEYDVDTAKIKNNQALSDILLPEGISHSQIFELVNKSDTVFNVRGIRSGNQYFLLHKKDSTHDLEHMVYAINAADYVVFNFEDSITVQRDSKPVEYVIRTAQGEITSSLSQSLDEQGVSPALAVKMADIFAWTIDFYRLQKGDAFKVLYEEKLIDGEPYGIGEIEAIAFKHYNDTLNAYSFMVNNSYDYYDEEGQSMRKAFLQAPLKFGRISSAYTKRRFHPVQRRYKAHLGTDYAAPKGTPILAVGDGYVTHAKYGKYNGNYVKIKHNSVYTTQYLHMSKIAKGMKPGVFVKQGQVIGYVGSTGLATGPHVCFRFWKNGAQVDHRREKLPAAEPIKAEWKDDFLKRADSLDQYLHFEFEEAMPVDTVQQAIS